MLSNDLKKPPLAILLLLVSFASVGAVLFTPALPMITSAFHLSVGQGQLTITAYLVGYAIGQLPYGPLANRFGRKKTLYIGISIAILGSLLCAFSSPLESFNLLIFARFLQALGACVGLKVSYTMIADVYNQVDATKVLSRLLVAFAIMPGIAVAIGGYLTKWLNWESCFYFLALFGVFMLWLCTRLPETVKSLDRHAMNIHSIAEGYGLKFKNKRVVISGLALGCASSVIYVFASKAPFIGINLIGLTPDQFGAYNLIPVVGMLLGAFISAKLAGRFSVMGLILSGIVASLIVSFTQLIPFSLGNVNPASLFFPLFLIYITSSVIFTNITSFGLAHAQNKSNGSAVMNFINLSTTVVAVLLSEFIYPESAILLPLSIQIFFLAMLLLAFWIKRLETGNSQRSHD